jgi:hypothetical protein
MNSGRKKYRSKVDLELKKLNRKLNNNNIPLIIRII